jgi:hypothetical protein
MGGLAGCLHPNTTCHFSSSPPPPLSLQTVRWRGTQETVGTVYRVDEQCGVAGALRCVNFMFSFFFFTDPPTPNILQTSARIFVVRPHPHPLRLSLPKTSGRVLHHWPSPSHRSRPSPLNKHRDNTVNDEHRRDEPMTAPSHLCYLISKVRFCYDSSYDVSNINLIQLNLDHPPIHAHQVLPPPLCTPLPSHQFSAPNPST